MDEEARSRPESRRQELPLIGDTTVGLETVGGRDAIAFGSALAADDALSVGVHPGRSLLATTCPFFRRETADGTLGRPIEMPEPINRCAAYGDARAQSLRQQELVCLTSRHVDCPRYLRASASPRRPPRARRVTRAILAAIAILLVSATVSFAFVLVRGGLALPAAPSPTGAVEAATATPAATVVAVAASPSPEPTPAPTPTVAPTPAPTPTPPPVAPATPAPTSDRYALLEPCPDKPNCYIYTVRPRDTLSGIANYFGTTLATVRQLNPWTRTKGLQPGQQLILPTPTR